MELLFTDSHAKLEAVLISSHLFAPALCTRFFKSDRSSLVSVFICLLISYTNGQAKELPTYKDNDFINDGQKIYIDEENKKMFLEKLRKDVEVRS